MESVFRIINYVILAVAAVLTPIFIAIVMIARIVVLAHFMSDVLAGFLAALVPVCLFGLLEPDHSL